MTRSELIERISYKNPQLSDEIAEKIVDLFFDEITYSLSHGDRVELRGFGVFGVKFRKARKGRNPRTGESVQVEAKHVPYYKIGKELHERLNPQLSDE